MKIKELFSDKTKWTQGAFARDKNGECITRPNDGFAVCWCLDGAMQRCYSKDYYDYINDKIVNKVKSGVILWNDDSDRTFEQVKQMVEELDI